MSNEEKIFIMGKSFVLRLRKDYPAMIEPALGVVQNPYGFTPEQKKQHVGESLEHLYNVKKQLDEEFDALIGALRNHGEL